MEILLTILIWIVLGAVLGLMGWAFIPRGDNRTRRGTVGAGALGALLGGLPTRMIREADLWMPPDFLMAIFGAALVLVIYIIAVERTPSEENPDRTS